MKILWGPTLSVIPYVLGATAVINLVDYVSSVAATLAWALPVGAASGCAAMLINPAKPLGPGEKDTFEVGGCSGCFLSAVTAFGAFYVLVNPDPGYEPDMVRQSWGLFAFGISSVATLWIVKKRQESRH